MFPFYNKCMWSEISVIVHAVILLAIKCMPPCVVVSFIYQKKITISYAHTSNL
jgi:hypothetical protein